jgi:anhydro-N-acetylmuramic acid kinase
LVVLYQPGEHEIDYLGEANIEVGEAFADADGRWATTRGQVIPNLMSRLLADPYFSFTPPKSTGTEYFNLT